MTEKRFMADVLRFARLLGWRCYHAHDSRRSAAGFPDLCMVRRGRLIFAELKSEKGRPTPAQRAWLADLSQNQGVEVYLWRPCDTEAIAQALQ